VFALLTAASLSVSACSATEVCNCPAGGGTATFATTSSNPIVDVGTDAPCSASKSNDAQVSVSRPSPGTCVVRAQLMNGDTYAVTMQFQSVNPGGCCSNITYAADMSTPAPISGADGG
jgi:hypothetical protein